MFNSKKTFDFVDRNFGWIIVAYLLCSAIVFGLFAWIGYKVLQHFGII